MTETTTTTTSITKTTTSPVFGTGKQPEISYQPNPAVYAARTAWRKANETFETILPPGFPAQLDSPLAWKGSDFASGSGRENEWVYEFNAKELAEIEAALAHFESLGLPTSAVSAETFPLPTLHPTLRALSHRLHHNLGFLVLRRLPFSSPSPSPSPENTRNIILHAGVTSHLFPARGRQDHQHLGKPADVTLTHITDLTHTGEKGIGAPAYTREGQVFHTDQGADVVSLACLEEAAGGGESVVVSSWSVYNELARERPDLIHTLSKDWVFDGFNNPNQPYTTKPILYHQPATPTTPERIIIQYARRSLTGYQDLIRSPTIPPITEAQAEALDALHFAGEKVKVELEFKKGDVQYVNNLAVMHARRGFVDKGEKKRHLLRIWCRDPEFAWVTPEQLRPKWGAIWDDVGVKSEEVLHDVPRVRSASSAVMGKVNHV